MKINFLYTSIGRGHPMYLDGIRACLPKQRIGSVEDVFSVSSPIPRMVWTLARTLYTRASSKGGGRSLYTRLRRSNNYNTPGPAMRLLGYDIEKKYRRDETPLLVAHPILAGMLKGKPNLYYQHGEVVAPKDALVTGPHTTFVPTRNVADAFIRAGAPADQVMVTGLCVEPSLCVNAAALFEKRLRRLRENESLCGAFFSSGAEPAPHVEKLIAAAGGLAAAGGECLVFAVRDGKLATVAKALTEAYPERFRLYPFTTREELDTLTAHHFERFDFFVAPSHERSNWALGLGLPLCMVDPPIGTFAPLNRHRLLDHGVAIALPTQTEAGTFGRTCNNRARRDALLRMAEQGWDHEAITGFTCIAEYLQQPHRETA